jgi:acetyl esterase/lipase
MAARCSVSACGPDDWFNSVDLWPAETGAQRPVLVFVSGGGWSGAEPINGRADCLCRAACARGFACAVLRHRPCKISALGAALLVYGAVLPFMTVARALRVAAAAAAFVVALNNLRRAVPMAQAVQDCARGVAHVHAEARSHGGDPSRIVLCGNSSGGHLLSLLAVHPTWLSTVAVPHSAIAATVDVSGVSSLRDGLPWPIVAALRMLYFGLDVGGAATLSPLEWVHAAVDDVCPFVLVTAEWELPGIKAVSRRFGDALEARNVKVTRLTVPRSTHFTAIRSFDAVLRDVAALVEAPRPIQSEVWLRERASDGWLRERAAASGFGSAGAAASAPTRLVLGPTELCALAPTDALFASANFKVCACIELEGGPRSPSLDEIVARVGRVAARLPILRARLLRIGNTWYWQPDRSFDPRRHVSEAPSYPGIRADLDAAVANEARTAALPSDRPPWRCTVHQLARGRAALVLTVHHAIGDGAFLATSLLPVLDNALAATPPLQRRASAEAAASEKRRRLFAERDADHGALAAAARRLQRAAWRRLRHAANAAALVAVQPPFWVSQGLNFLRAEQLPLDRAAPLSFAVSDVVLTGSGDVGAVRETCGASVADILLAALAGCMRRRAARPFRRPLLLMLPAMTAAPEIDAPLERHVGNGLGGLFVRLPVHIADPAARLADLRGQTAPLKRWMVAASVGFVARLLFRLAPAPLIPPCVNLHFRLLSFAGISSFRGPPDASLCGCDASRFYFFGTFHPPRLPVMAALSSVGDRLSVALALKSGALGADAPALIAALPEELAALRAAVVDDS